ncbi:response regulator [[Phormidium] sp. ETS-05]|uniref:response regulator n=1 Tax=[Phormidium] sp. ETS-05 TaxID=222819 RepID=UPI0018EF33BE|nr:response regulator [[Phormidium] sp. ETS-05]
MTKRILIIDDDDYIRELTQISLEIGAGWEVVGAGSGKEGIAKAEAEQPDAILLDVMMPNMDGMDTLQALRCDAKMQHIPVIFFTAIDSDRRDKLAQTLGVAAVFDKPFDPITLASKVAEVLGWS